MDRLEPVVNVMVIHGNGLTALALYLTILSGYLVVAYIAGTDLERVQVYFINTIFVFFAGILALYSSVLFYAGLRFGPGEGAPDRYFYALFIIIACEMIAILGAIKFMYDIRARKQAGKTSGNDT